MLETRVGVYFCRLMLILSLILHFCYSQKPSRVEIPIEYSPEIIFVESYDELWIEVRLKFENSSGLEDESSIRLKYEALMQNLEQKVPNWKNSEVSLLIEDTSKLILKNFTLSLSQLFEDYDRGLNNSGIRVKGDIIGRSRVYINIFTDEVSSGITMLPSSIPVAIIRDASGEKLTLIFVLVISILSVINTFMMGAQLDLNIIRAVLKRPIGPVIGFCCQFILMPLLAFGWCYIMFGNDTGLMLGLFAVGCSPGGGASNFWTIMLDGNIDLSVTMTFLSGFAALFMMPFWFFTLGRIIFGGRVSIPFLNIFGGLATLVLPAGFGILFRRKYPETAKKFKRVIKLTTLCILLFVYTFGIYANWFIWRLFTWRTILSGMFLPWSAFILAFTVCFFLRLNTKDCRTIAIETGIQNGGVAIILLQFSLPAPERDLSIVPPVCVLTFTALPLWGVLLYRTIRKRWFPKNEDGGGSKPSNGVSTISSHFTRGDSSAAYDNRGANLRDDGI